MREATVLALVAAVALGGCIESLGSNVADAPALDVPADWAALALASEHDHADPHAHAGLTTPNFRILGWDPLVSEEYGTSVPGTLCGDAAEVEGGRRLAAIQGRNDVVLIVADVTDPANPERLGELVMRTTYVYDAAVAPDGKHVVLVTDNARRPDRAPLVGSGLAWRTACAPGGEVEVAALAEELVPRPSSLVVVSIADPAKPAVVAQRPIGDGHGVSVSVVDGKQIVAAAALACTSVPVTTGVAIPALPVSTSRCPSFAASWHFLELGADGALTPLSTYRVPVEISAKFAQRQNRHNDAWIQTHPVTGQTLAYLAAWDDGFHFLDLTDPADPRLLGTWSDHDPSAAPEDSGKAHSAAPLPVAWDGRHYTVVGPEHSAKPTSRPTGVVYVLDTTDPAAPRAVAAWTLPHDVHWEGRLQFSPHYVSVLGKTAFVSMYHGGVWAVDLSKVGTADFVLLDAVGVFMPVNESPHPPEEPMRWAPTLEEALAFPDGTLVTFDANTGVYTFAFDEARPAPPPAPWPIENPDAA